MNIYCRERAKEPGGNGSGPDERIRCIRTEEYAEIEFAQEISDAYVELEYTLPFQADGEDYVFLPACCYDGNRFEVSRQDYPPLFTPEEARVDMPVTITDVPRLNKDGSGIIEVTTGDVSVPCIGIYSKKENKALFLFTIQQIDGINLGLSYEQGIIRVSYPHMRKKEMYRWPHMRPGTDKGIRFEKGARIRIPYRLLEISCESLREFFHIFFINRKCMGLDDVLPKTPDPRRQFEIQRDKMNRLNWKEEGQFYGVETGNKEEPSWQTAWQPGWVGGGMYTYPLMKLGGELEWERGMQTLKHIFKGQAKSGLLYEFSDGDGHFTKGIFHRKGSEQWALVRKSGDVLYYLFKHFRLMKERGVTVPEQFEEGARRLADAFVTLWKQYGQYGQFANLDTGELIVGGSVSGGIIPGGLAEAAAWFGEEEYLTVAKESAQQYCEQVLKEGYTTGGPEEILQCPDSESAFGLLESLAVLYEQTGERQWLEYGTYLIEFCSSWVVAYNYRFPENSEFHRLDMKSTGCVFANVQNKHAAPGICTFSGYRIYQFYQWTGEEKYLELYRDITGTVAQYLSTEERPIHSWTVPKDAALCREEDLGYQEPEVLPPGYICERVNLSDWETERCVGGVFNGSCCWCETANLMILAECQGI